MGFMDKAKKMAEQAQAKLDEAQKQFNSGEQPGQPSGPPVEYDAQGRPIPSSPPPTPGVPPTGQGDPLPGAAPAEGAAQIPQPGVPPASAASAPRAPAAEPSGDAPAEDRNHPSYAPPKLSSGDPLAG